MSYLYWPKRIARKLLGRGDHGPVQTFDTEEFELVFENDLLRITRLGDAASPNVIICFTGIQHGMAQISTEEFVGSSQMADYSAVFVSDLKCSWYNNFAPAMMLDAIAPLIAGKRVVTMGNSMGGFGAIWASGHVKAHAVIAFAPQFSVHSEVVPNETRWQNFRQSIAHWRVPSLANSFDQNATYITINGDADGEHFQKFPHGENRVHLLVHDSHHNPAKMLKERGVLKEVIALCARGEDPFNIIEKAGTKVSRIRPQ